jgi:hypothetical protein
MKTFIHTTIKNIDGSVSPVVLAVSTRYVEHYRVFVMMGDYAPYSPIVFD